MEFLSCPAQAWYVAFPHPETNEAEGVRVTMYFEVIAWQRDVRGGVRLRPVIAEGQDSAIKAEEGTLCSATSLTFLQDLMAAIIGPDDEPTGAPLVQPQPWGYLVTEVFPPEAPVFD